ncbi:MAG TPA: DUF2892 domain-containing protein [Bryobacteraceae bacterium]|nr:DUF2892 domain-containing protein [Bryobacteraceae bacterium]
MTVDRYLRMIGGGFVVLSLALGYWVSPYWFLFTGFVGLNLFQSAFTNWCPMMTILRKLGVKEFLTPASDSLRSRSTVRLNERALAGYLLGRVMCRVHRSELPQYNRRR